MSIETAREIMQATNNPNVAEEYVHTVREIQRAIDIIVDPQLADSAPHMVVATRHAHTYNLSNRLDHDNPAVKASMLDGAISLKGFRYRDFSSPNPISTYEAIWSGTKLQGLAAKCDEMVDDLKPPLDGRYTHIDLPEMWIDFNKILNAGGPEHLIITGLNGVGKSTHIEALMAFLRMSNIRSQLVKLPRPNGPLSEVLKKILSGEKKIDPGSVQHVFLADALDERHETTDTFVVYDRSPRRDALVYGPENMILTILAANEMFEGNVWTVILDRHFRRTHSEVERRKTKSRIFERNAERMVDQFIRFSGLTFLPGVIWVNGDTASTVDRNEQIEYTMRKFFGGIFATGVIQRHMVKHSLAESPQTANDFLMASFLEFLDRWKTTPQWIKKMG